MEYCKKASIPWDSMNPSVKIKKTIAVDFDGVIHKYSKGWNDGTIYDEPVKGAINGLIELLKEYHIYIHTTRNVPDVVKWMNGDLLWGKNSERAFVTVAMPEGTRFWQGGMFKVAVSNLKLPAVAYIDDRAILFTDWNEIPEKLKEIKE